MEFKLKKPTSSNRTVRMPDELIDTLNQLAAKKDISFNQVVIQCCEFALQHIKEDDEEN